MLRLVAETNWRLLRAAMDWIPFSPIAIQWLIVVVIDAGGWGVEWTGQDSNDRTLTTRTIT